MKKLALIIGLIVAVNILFAQEKKESTEEKPPVKIEKYKERLKLSESQIEDLKKMRESLKPELETIREDESKSRSERMQLRADIMKKHEESIAAILDEKQEAELKEIHREIRDKAREKRKRRRDRRNG